VRYETRVEEHNFAVGDPATWRERGSPTEKRTGPTEYTIFVETFAEAQGIWFYCPGCFVENGGIVGTAHFDITFEGRGALPSQGSKYKNGPVRWSVSGTGLEDLTLSPSIKVPDEGPEHWHGYITNGEVRAC